jgi:DNA-binding response OmpR family regulator
MRILVIEDDHNTGHFLKAALGERCYAVDLENDGEAGYRRARAEDYDLIVLDNMLPGKLGIDICRELREAGKTMPILMLSVESSTEKKVDLLRCGADDYVTKPFSIEEMTARIEALLRRPRQMLEKQLQVDDLTLDRDTFGAMRGGTSVYLTLKEYELLEYLMRNQGRVVSRGMILEHVWDMNADLFSNTIETHIMKLRRKIDTTGRKKLIHTVPGRGYKMSLAL